ncbi:glycosyltransferase family 39 protein [Streptomyces sp. NPDC051776]|uniref:ArnT family glycosyltransferase n=1 Tax=Streptomyces sp. NPDC051776 TaxID=3155414 RepID=UPI00341D6475
MTRPSHESHPGAGNQPGAHARQAGSGGTGYPPPPGTVGPAGPSHPARSADPRWARPALAALLLATALLYLWNLSVSGYANSFYSAAAQAGSESWKAFFFGASDAPSSITVDKPPAALWPMALSVKTFGLNSWAVLVPEALMGVGAVGVLYASVKRRFGPAAGLIAGGVLALTPAAALMFRFNNPDALLALLMTCAVACVLRALEAARTKWLVLAGVTLGLAFLVKTLQALVILPPLVLLYAVCAPTAMGKRIRQLALAGLAMVVSGGWWVAIVELWPADSRPYIGGSQNNSFLELTFGYNGLGRINGEETGSVGGGGGPGGGGRWGETGIGRMFNDSVGGQISWLLPAALILLVACLVLLRRDERTDVRRAAFLAWGGALLMTAAVFSFMAGIFHEYYTVALAPYIAALVGIGAVVLWERRKSPAVSAVLGGAVAVTAVWSYVLLGRSADWLPWLRWVVLVGGLVAAAGLMLGGGRTGRGLALGAAGLGLAASLAGPFAYTLSTIDSPHSGGIVTAGPQVSGGAGRAGGPGGPGQGAPGQSAAPGQGGPGGGPGQGGGTQQQPGQQGQGGQQGLPGQQGAAGGQGGPGGGGSQQGPQGRTGQNGAQGGAGRGGMNGLLNGQMVSAELAAELEQDAGAYTWIAAAVGAQNAASYQLATEEPVMPLGGFNGSDPSPTLAQFKEYVEHGRIHYFISTTGGTGPGAGGGPRGTGGQGGTGGQPGPGGGQGGGAAPGGRSPNSASSVITSWVEETFTQVTVDGTTLYDLTDPVSDEEDEA